MYQLRMIGWRWRLRGDYGRTPDEPELKIKNEKCKIMDLKTDLPYILKHSVFINNHIDNFVSMSVC